MAKAQSLGVPDGTSRKTWVQTDRDAHVEWDGLIARSPIAARLAHRLVALMGSQNAVVVSQKTLATLLGCAERTVRYAVKELVAGRWIQVVRVGAAGPIHAYIVNDQIAWGEKRELIGRLSLFSARVVAAEAEQPAAVEPVQLRRIPVLFPASEAA